MDRLENMDFNDRSNQSSREIFIYFASYSGSENLSTRFLKSFDCFLLVQSHFFGDMAQTGAAASLLIIFQHVIVN